MIVEIIVGLFVDLLAGLTSGLPVGEPVTVPGIGQVVGIAMVFNDGLPLVELIGVAQSSLVVIGTGALYFLARTVRQWLPFV